MEKLNLKDKDNEGSKQMVRIDKLNLIKNSFRRLNVVDEGEADLPQKGTNTKASGEMTDTMVSMKSESNNKVKEEQTNNNFL